MGGSNGNKGEGHEDLCIFGRIGTGGADGRAVRGGGEHPRPDRQIGPEDEGYEGRRAPVRVEGLDRGSRQLDSQRHVRCPVVQRTPSLESLWMGADAALDLLQWQHRGARHHLRKPARPTRLARLRAAEPREREDAFRARAATRRQHALHRPELKLFQYTNEPAGYPRGFYICIKVPSYLRDITL